MLICIALFKYCHPEGVLSLGNTLWLCLILNFYYLYYDGSYQYIIFEQNLFKKQVTLLIHFNKCEKHNS